MGNQSVQKRNRERQRQEKAVEKQRRREERRNQKEIRPPPADGSDPDLAGIVPGPQPTEESVDDPQNNDDTPA
ncbi:MAG TPA: hypothetical protein VL172_13595 [Kofleriaceae bacterium]|jgi:hypothetical protein|nr:hypothetical protein [Kofleriaceae bacterium]